VSAAGGDRNRNARLARLRELVPVSNAIVGTELADKTQTVVVTDHDSRVLARRTFRRRAWDLGAALEWAAGKAITAGYVGVTVACEPTGHRWRVLGQLAADRGMAFVCVQPLMSSWARRGEDLTFDKTDDKDAVLIARLTAQRARGGGPDLGSAATPRGAQAAAGDRDGRAGPAGP
jgi:transposase